MLEAYKKVWVNFANFKGCSSRADYWYFVLCNAIISVVISVVLNLVGLELAVASSISSIYSLAILVPSLAVIARRLHDTNRSGWTYLLILIPLVGLIIILVFLCSKRVEPNKYGEQI